MPGDVTGGGDNNSRGSPTADPLAVAAFVVALAGLLVPPLLLVGVGLGIAGLVRSTQRGGWGLAGAAVALGGTASVVTATTAVVLATAPFSPLQPQRWLRGGESAPVAAAAAADNPSPTSAPSATTTPSDGSWTVAVDELKPGDCVEELLEAGELDELTLVSCREPHAYEIFDTFPVAEDAWPGDAGIEEIAVVGCGERLDDALARYGVGGDNLELWLLFPTEDSWDRGDRSVTCGIYDVEDGVLDPGQVISGTAVPRSSAED